MRAIRTLTSSRNVTATVAERVHCLERDDGSVIAARQKWNPVSRHRGLRPVQGAACEFGYDLANAPMLLSSDRPRSDQHIVIESQCRAHVALTSEASSIKHQIARPASSIKRADTEFRHGKWPSKPPFNRVNFGAWEWRAGTTSTSFTADLMAAQPRRWECRPDAMRDCGRPQISPSSASAQKKPRK